MNAEVLGRAVAADHAGVRRPRQVHGGSLASNVRGCAPADAKDRARIGYIDRQV